MNTDCKVNTRIYARLNNTVLLGFVMFALFGALAAAPLVSQAAPEAEVVHWWDRGADREAVNVLRDEFERRGGIWFDNSGTDMVKALDEAVSRMAKGYSPTLVQWNTGWEVEQFYKLGLLRSIRKGTLDTQLRTKLIDSVVDNVSVDGNIIALPVNVHSENWIWLRRRTNSPSPSLNDWDQLLGYAKSLHESGTTAIAIGVEPWQRRILFNSILLSEFGAERFTRLFRDLDVSLLSEKAFDNTLRIFTDLKPYSRTFGEGRWDQQVAGVAAGDAEMFFMGDWAKGEFGNLGLELDKDFYCLQAPGTANHLMLVIDALVLGNVDSALEKQGQDLFLQVITDLDTSIRFNQLKGSLSPLKDINTDSLDTCNRLAHDSLQNQNQVIPSFSNFGDRGFLGTIERIISDLWDGRVSIDSTRELLRLALTGEARKRQSVNVTVRADD